MVDARRHFRNLLVALALLAGLGAGTARADSGDPMGYYGGPVAHSATAVLVDWGSHVSPLFTNPTSGDPGLLKFLAASSGRPDVTGGVLAQYMDASGHNSANQVTYAGQYTLASAPSAARLPDWQVASQLVSGIGSGRLPSPAGDGLSTIYLVLFPSGTSVCGSEGCTGQAICSYHGATALPDGTHVLYVVLPDDTGGPMSQGCGGESTAFANQTSYLTHEWAEAINDPLVTQAGAMGPPLAWYDGHCPKSTSVCGEVADKCNQQTTVQGGWTVQLLWSNLDRACVGSERRFVAPSVAFAPPPAAAPGVPLLLSAGATDPGANTTAVSYAGHLYALPPAIASVTWSFGDGSQPVTGLRASHTFAAPGVYPVSVTARDQLGFASTTTHPVAVWGPLGAPAASTGAAVAGPRGARLAGVVAPAGLGVGYRFDYGIGSLTASTPVNRLAAGTAGRPVSAAVGDLRPGAGYEYRLDVVVGGLVLPGAVQTFATPPGRAHLARARRRRRHHRARRRVRAAMRRTFATIEAIPVGAEPLPGQMLSRELSDGLLVRVSCPGGCRAAVLATLRVGAAAVPRALAQSAVTVGPRGGAVARLRFSPSARAWLRHAGPRGSALAVSAYAR